MKKIIYLSLMVSLLVTPLSAIEKQDCSNIKKFSKAFIACKSGNFNAGVVNTIGAVKKNTIGKVKKQKSVTGGEEITTGERIKTAARDKKESIKKSFDNIFKSSTKQYPRGTKK